MHLYLNTVILESRVAVFQKRSKIWILTTCQEMLLGDKWSHKCQLRHYLNVATPVIASNNVSAMSFGLNVDLCNMFIVF